MHELQHQLRRLRRALWGSPEPVTRTLLAINALTFLTFFLSAYVLRLGNPWAWLTFSTGGLLGKPWTLLTYPLVTYDPLTLLFAGYWLWVVGGTLERSWTSPVFLRFVAGVTLATSLSLWVGGWLLAAIGLEPPRAVVLSGLWLPLAGLTVAWCRLNPEQIVLLGFVLPIPGRVLLWITVALVYFGVAMGWRAPWLGLFALAGVGYAYLFVERRLRSPLTVYARTIARRDRAQGERARPPTPLERALDWLLLYWERAKRRYLRPRR